MTRRPLLAIVLLSAVLHGVGIARAPLPAQDGLKFLRVAREYHRKPWTEVVRGSDQHPLYPAAIAIVQPAIATFFGDGADSWRISAQAVSTIASLLTLIALYGFVSRLFDASKAAMACLLFVLLPLPTALGHETLSDSLAVSFLTATLALTQVSLGNCVRLSATQTGRSRIIAAVACGMMAGLGYLTRPELAIAPLAILLWVGLRFVSRLRATFRNSFLHSAWECRLAGSAGLPCGPEAGRSNRPPATPILALFSVVFLVFVGSYALVKGEVSEKLAVRRTAAISSIHDTPAKPDRILPPGLDDPHWDFSAKEESNSRGPIGAPQAAILLISRWSESLGLILFPLAIVGAWRARSRVFSVLLLVYTTVFSLILIRHATTFGYLSSRHVLSLMMVSLPFAASAIIDAVRSVKSWRERRSLGTVPHTAILRMIAVMAMLIVGLSVQFHRPPHQSRWGQCEAGRWLAKHASDSQTVLDTRGWASFVSGRSAHDYWHVRQALTDPKLAFIVVGEDELTATSKRAKTLRALLAFAAEPVAEFPERKGGRAVGVRIYEFHPPRDWKGMIP